MSSDISAEIEAQSLALGQTTVRYIEQVLSREIIRIKRFKARNAESFNVMGVRKTKPSHSASNSQDRFDFVFAVGKSLAKRRLELGITQLMVAQQAGLHRTYIGDLEKGYRNPTIDCLVGLSGALNISMRNICRYAEAWLEDSRSD